LLRLYYYASFYDHLPRKYVDEHEAMIQAIEARDAERCDELAAAHAAQIVRQIQSYMTRDVTAQMRLDEPGSRPARPVRA
jgi:DNA-binding GntR family transcriptional regulator